MAQANITSQLAQVLGLTPPANATPQTKQPAPLPAPPAVKSYPAVIPQNTGDLITDDAEFARDNLYDIVLKTTDAINELMQVAVATQHPRAFEVLEKLLMRQQDAVKQLLEIQIQKKELTGAAGITAPTANVIANAVFIGTNAELLDMLRGTNRNKEIEHDGLS